MQTADKELYFYISFYCFSPNQGRDALVTPSIKGGTPSLPIKTKGIRIMRDGIFIWEAHRGGGGGYEMPESCKL